MDGKYSLPVFPRGLARTIKRHPRHICRVRLGQTSPSPKLALAIYQECRRAGLKTRLTDILRPDPNFLELCKILVRENRK